MLSALNYRLLFRHIRQSLFQTRGTSQQLTAKRIRTLLIFLVIYPAMVVFASIGFFIDDILFRGYRDIRVRRPVFIIGNFRSGSTLLQRLLSADRQTFTSLQTWEIYLAPSITQRKFIQGVLMLDSLLGGHVARWGRRKEESMFGDIHLHRIRLREAEEDEGILLYIWSGMFVWFFFPVPGAEMPYIDFEYEVSRMEKRRIMRFYHACVKRHLYTNPGPVFLSKNPSFSPKLPTLLENFPDARIIYLARDPATMLPSEVAWLSFAWRYFSDPVEHFPFKDDVKRLAHLWYYRPLEVLSRVPDNRKLVIRFEDLIEDPAAVVEGIYRKFGLEMTEGAAVLLAEALGRAHEHENPRKTTLAELGMTEETIRDEFAAVVSRFDYPVTRPKGPVRR